MDQKLKSSISKMIVNGNRLELPKDEQLSNYTQVKKCLINAGGKYKKCGFEFNTDPTPIVNRLLGGEEVNDKKKYQFFATPIDLVEMLMNFAQIKPSDSVLEPSGGHGAIADEIAKINDHITVVELMPENTDVLRDKGYDVYEQCFLKFSTTLGHFDKIIANPPFTKNQDIDHVLHMHKLLNPGGRIVSVMSTSWIFGVQKKQLQFRKWLEEVGAEVIKVPPGKFKSSGTSVASTIVIINKG